MKKFFCGFLAVFMLTACVCFANAEAPALSENMFKYAKAALTCLHSGEYDKIVTGLPFSGVSPSADEWRSFAQGVLPDDTPQTKYAVAYWMGVAWKIAVPVSEPDSSDTITFVLLSEDGSSFSGYGCTSWGKVEKEYRSSQYVSWNEEYAASTSVIIGNDE